jgi:hypothetical protein
MRTILINIPGATSFEFLRTVKNIVYPTFQEAAIELGLMEDDKEWDECLSEAINSTTDIKKLRSLFVMILTYSQPALPAKLWEKHKFNLCADILYAEKQKQNEKDIEFSQDMFNLGLFYINEELQKNGKSLKNFVGMPLLPPGYKNTQTINYSNNRLIQEQLNYDT